MVRGYGIPQVVRQEIRDLRDKVEAEAAGHWEARAVVGLAGAAEEEEGEKVRVEGQASLWWFFRARSLSLSAPFHLVRRGTGAREGQEPQARRVERAGIARARVASAATVAPEVPAARGEVGQEESHSAYFTRAVRRPPTR
jgi:hypothetical protein